MPGFEYAKVKSWYAPGTVYGLRANITLPSTSSIGGHLGNGFINFYYSLNGSGLHYEIGLSQNLQNQGRYWHWMYTVAKHDNGGGVYNIPQGSTVLMELSENPSTKLMELKLNNSVVKTFSGSGSFADGFTEAHLVIGACDMYYETKDEIEKPLPPWKTRFDKVVISNYSYRNAAGYWVTVDTEPQKEEHWPSPESSYPHTGSPLYYGITHTTPGNMTATL